MKICNIIHTWLHHSKNCRHFKQRRMYLESPEYNTWSRVHLDNTLESPTVYTVLEPGTALAKQVMTWPSVPSSKGWRGMHWLVGTRKKVLFPYLSGKTLARLRGILGAFYSEASHASDAIGLLASRTLKSISLHRMKFKLVSQIRNIVR